MRIDLLRAVLVLGALASQAAPTPTPITMPAPPAGDVQYLRDAAAPTPAPAHPGAASGVQTPPPLDLDNGGGPAVTQSEELLLPPGQGHTRARRVPVHTLRLLRISDVGGHWSAVVYVYGHPQRVVTGDKLLRHVVGAIRQDAVCLDSARHPCDKLLAFGPGID